MKKNLILLLTLGAATVLSAQDAPATTYSVTADFPFASSYVFRGVKYAKESFQPSIKVTSGGAYGGIWFNQPIDNDYDNEIDFYGGYNFALSEKWTLDVGATLYYYPQLDTSAGGDSTTIEGYVGLNGTVADGITVGGYAYRDFTLEATTVQAAVGYSVPVSEKLTCTFTATLGLVSADEGDDYSYYGASVQLPYKISDKATITVGGNYASSDIDEIEQDLFWANVGFTYAF